MSAETTNSVNFCTPFSSVSFAAGFFTADSAGAVAAGAVVACARVRGLAARVRRPTALRLRAATVRRAPERRNSGDTIGKPDTDGAGFAERAGWITSVSRGLVGNWVVVRKLDLRG